MIRSGVKVRDKVFWLHFQNWQIKDPCEGVKPEDCPTHHPRGQTLDKTAQAQSDRSRDSEMKAQSIRYSQEMSKYSPLFQAGGAWPNKNEELWIRKYVSTVFVSIHWGPDLSSLKFFGDPHFLPTVVFQRSICSFWRHILHIREVWFYHIRHSPASRISQLKCGISPWRGSGAVY